MGHSKPSPTQVVFESSAAVRLAGQNGAASGGTVVSTGASEQPPIATAVKASTPLRTKREFRKEGIIRPSSKAGRTGPPLIAKPPGNLKLILVGPQLAARARNAFV